MTSLPMIVPEDDEPMDSRQAIEAVAEQARRRGMEVIQGMAPPALPRRPRPKGRPTRLHAVLIEEIAARVRAGEHQDAAALAVGVAASTYFSWKAKGDEARQRLNVGGTIPPNQAIYVEFLEAIEEARALAEARVIQAVQRAAIGGEVSSIREWTDEKGELHREVTFSRPNVAAMTWWLERAHPQRYGRKVEVSGPGGEAIPVEVEVSARDLLKKKLGEAASRLGVATTTEED